jgi:hypothetical protein
MRGQTRKGSRRAQRVRNTPESGSRRDAQPLPSRAMCCHFGNSANCDGDQKTYRFAAAQRRDVDEFGRNQGRSFRHSARRLDADEVCALCFHQSGGAARAQSRSENH